MLSISFCESYSQANISGSINSYAKVTDVTSDNSVTVDDPDLFSPGDTVLIIQMKGIGITLDESDGGLNWGKKQFFNNSGNYEFLVISEITGNSIIFTRDLMKSYNASETVQLVRVRGFENATVTGELTADEWDGDKGGVIALIVTNTLTLEADINATGKGFSGGTPTLRTIDECSSENPEAYLEFHYPEGSQMAGRKGEGAVTYYWTGDDQIPIGDDFVHGRGRISGGGGGGNGHFAGGGGGANSGQGGLGGFEQETCEIDQRMRGVPGERMDDFFTEEYIGSRFFMAGGGGGSTSGNGEVASAGGNGGGMVIIIADRIVGNGHYIISNGGSVTEYAENGGAGGGGGGGSIIAAVDNFENQLTLRARGGNGGNVQNDLMSGPGGGGGGGTILSIHNLPGEVTLNLGGGVSGKYYEPGSGSSGMSHGASDGNPGGNLTGVEMTLNGFLFNGIKEEQVICEEQTPVLIEGTMPKGGAPHPVDGYYYEWFRKTPAQEEWEQIPGAVEKNYQPEALTETTLYRRVVKDNDPDQVIDSSNVMEITVQPKILGNLISEEQTICEGDTPAPFTGAEPAQGGTGVFEYQWEQASGGSDWYEGEGDNTGIDYAPGALTDTTQYRRIVTSGMCADTSDVLPVYVHPLINNNIIEADQTVCEGIAPDELQSATPAEGGTGTYNYLWEQSTDLSDWTDADDPADTESLSPGVLPETTFFRRIINSGMCTDTSQHIEIIVLPSITNNIIGNPQTICYDTQPEEFHGSQPQGGDEPLYSYRWESSTDEETWTASGTVNSDINHEAPAIKNPAYFRRIVRSGEGDACRDTSNTVFVDFFPFSTAHISETFDEICSGDESTLTFSLSGDGPWDLSFTEGTTIVEINDISDETFEVAVTPETNVQSNTLEYTIYSVTDSYGCLARDEDLTGTASVTVYGYPDANAGEDSEACGLTTELDALPSFGNGTWSTPYTSAEFNPDPSDPGADGTVTEYGTHQFVWTEVNWLCSASDIIYVTFYEEPSQANAGPDQSLQFDFRTFMDAEMPAVGTGIWGIVSGSGNIISENDPLTEVTGLEMGENIFEWSVINGVCPVSTDLVSIHVSDLDAPTGFSPNNSGLNDFFVIKGLENSSSNRLVVFNRQGNEVYRAFNYQNDWDGRNRNGNILPNDTYYYILEVDDKYTYKGFIVIRR